MLGPGFAHASAGHWKPPSLTFRGHHKRRSSVTQDRMHEQRNRWGLLTQTGAGTPMGDLLRRYWWPIAGVSELDDAPTKPVRLMGEDLALYKDRSGCYGLIDRHCPHRRADMTY